MHQQYTAFSHTTQCERTSHNYTLIILSVKFRRMTFAQLAKISATGVCQSRHVLPLANVWPASYFCHQSTRFVLSEIKTKTAFGVEQTVPLLCLFYTVVSDRSA